jgi:hypothetical protein
MNVLGIPRKATGATFCREKLSNAKWPGDGTVCRSNMAGADAGQSSRAGDKRALTDRLMKHFILVV